VRPRDIVGKGVGGRPAAAVEKATGRRKPPDGGVDRARNPSSDSWNPYCVGWRAAVKNNGLAMTQLQAVTTIAAHWFRDYLRNPRRTRKAAELGLSLHTLSERAYTSIWVRKN
jgi:hypothetical protein